MRRFKIQLIVILALLLPAPALMAGGDDKSTSSTTIIAKKKVRVKVKKTASKGLERRKVRKKKSIKLPIPGQEPIQRKDKEKAEEGDEESRDIDFQHVLERTADYLRSPDGAANTARCFATIGNGVLKARKEEKKKLVAAGLVSTVQDAFRDSVNEEDWGQQVRRVRQVRRARLAHGGRAARRLDAVEIVDIAEEVTTGCFFPYLRHVLRKTDAEKIVDEDKYIDRDKLAGDIAKAIAGAIAVGAKDVLISEAKGQINDKIEEVKDTVEGLVQDIVAKAKAKIAVVGEATKKLVEKLTPDIIENAVAQAKEDITSWFASWDDDDDSLESIVTQLDSDDDDVDEESEYEEEAIDDDEPLLVAIEDEVVEVVESDEDEDSFVDEQPKWSIFDWLHGRWSS